MGLIQMGTDSQKQLDYELIEELRQCKTLADFESVYPGYYDGYDFETVEVFAAAKAVPAELLKALDFSPTPKVPEHIEALLKQSKSQEQSIVPVVEPLPIALVELTKEDWDLAKQAGFWRAVENQMHPTLKAKQQASSNAMTDVYGVLGEIATFKAFGMPVNINTLVTFNQFSKSKAGADIASLAGYVADIKAAKFESLVGSQRNYGRESDPLKGAKGRFNVNINIPKHYRMSYPALYGKDKAPLDFYLIPLLDKSTDRVVVLTLNAKLVEQTWDRQVFSNRFGLRDKDPAFTDSFPIEKLAKQFDELFDMEKHSAGFITPTNPVYVRYLGALQAACSEAFKGEPSRHPKYETPQKVYETVKSGGSFKHYILGGISLNSLVASKAELSPQAPLNRDHSGR